MGALSLFAATPFALPRGVDVVLSAQATEAARRDSHGATGVAHRVVYASNPLYLFPGETLVEHGCDLLIYAVYHCIGWLTH